MYIRFQAVWRREEEIPFWNEFRRELSVRNVCRHVYRR